MEPIRQQPDDAELDALLQQASWPEPSRDSTRRLEQTWTQVSRAPRNPWRLPFAIAAAAAAVALFAFGVAIMTKTQPAENVAARSPVISVPTTMKSKRSPVLYAAGSREPTVRERLAMMSEKLVRRSRAEPTLPVPEVPQTASVDMLLSELDSPRSEVRYAAARELGRRSGPTTTAALVGRINAGRRPREAVAALLSSNSDDAADVVRQLRASPQWSTIVRSAENQLQFN